MQQRCLLYLDLFVHGFGVLHAVLERLNLGFQLLLDGVTTNSHFTKNGLGLKTETAVQLNGNNADLPKPQDITDHLLTPQNITDHPITPQSITVNSLFRTNVHVIGVCLPN